MRLYAFLSVLQIVLFSTLGLPLAQEWHVITVDSEYERGSDSSIVLDSSGYPHFAYTLYDPYYCEEWVFYIFWNGSSWQRTLIDTNYGSERTSIALDSSERPRVLYTDFFWCGLMYAYLDGDWQTEYIGTTDNDEGGDLALDSSDYPHISYCGEYGDLAYTWLDENGWHTELVDTEGHQGVDNSIAMDSYDRPHISYYDDSNRDLKYAYWDGSSWQISSVDTTGIVGRYTSIAVDSSDHPHISYMDTYNYDLKYAHWDGSIWQIETVDDLGYYASFTSIALDVYNRPHIIYGSGVKYAHWDGSSWVFENFSAEGDSSHLVLDGQNYPHISVDSSIYGLRYAWYGDPWVDMVLTYFSAKPQVDTITLRWSVETTEGDQIAGFNLYRRELALEDGVIVRTDGHPSLQEVNTTWLKINTNLITGENPYSYTDSDVESGVAYEYKLEAVLADDSPETLGTIQATAGQPTSFSILALYPNPASDYLTCLLALPEAGPVELSLYDLSGRLVLKQQLEATEPTELEATLDVSGLASGVYTLRANQDGAEVSARAVVVR